VSLTQIAARAQEESSLFLTPRDVGRVLSALLSTDDLWAVVDVAQVPIMALCAIWKVLAEEGLVTTVGKRVKLTPKGEGACREWGIHPPLSLTCPRCRGRGLLLGPVAEVADRFSAIARQRPEAIQDYDQGYVTEESTLWRVAFMWERGDLEGKELLVLGDDDLVSIAAALTGAPKRVAVLDIDRRLTDFLEEVARREGLALQVLTHDLCNPLPPSLTRRFDTFFTDPSESFQALAYAFVNRGLSALKGPGSAGYFGLTRLESSLEKWRQIQRFLLEAGAVITDILDNFNDYVNWPYVEKMRSWPHLPVQALPRRTWYRSALYRLELLGEPPKDERVLGVEVFEDEEAATV